MPLIDDAKQFVSENIGPLFHHRRLESLRSLQLRKVLIRKNPYLFKSKNLINAEDLVKSLVDAHLSSQEETVFGGFLEQVAIFCSQHTLGGRKSAVEGIDLEFEKDKTLHLVTIKSGPYWHNKSQLDKLKSDFLRACKTLNTNAVWSRPRCINGCCYGRIYKDYGNFEKISGEAFWTLISGDPHLFVEIVEPLGFEAKRHNDDFLEQYAQVRTKFSSQFIEEFCDSNYAINWEKIVRLNSETVVPRSAKAAR